MQVQEKTVITVAEAAEILGVSRPTVYDLCERSDFPALRIEKRKLILRQKFMLWLESQAGQGGVCA
ncbi:MAG: helix-turn-helix domain-containing protein [Defluviitaleaceae bacterium]|nr:helix-turn-helix domain-containing protein [Defluviitaleaceae bacterium]